MDVAKMVVQGPDDVKIPICDGFMVSATLEHVHTPFGEREVLLHGFRKAIEKFRSCAKK